VLPGAHSKRHADDKNRISMMLNLDFGRSTCRADSAYGGFIVCQRLRRYAAIRSALHNAFSLLSLRMRACICEISGRPLRRDFQRQ